MEAALLQCALSSTYLELNVLNNANTNVHNKQGGSRLCLGQNLATFEVILAMAALVKHYDFEFAPDYLANTEMAANAPM